MSELTEELKQQYQNYDQKKLNEAFIFACKNGFLDVVRYLLTSPDLNLHADIHANNGQSFEFACLCGHLEVVKYLLTSPDLKEHADIHGNDDLGFRWAGRFGHLEVVKYLLTSPDLNQHADIHANNDDSFKYACQHSRLNIAKYLLFFNGYQCVDFQRTEYNLDWALKNKHDDVIIAMMRNLKYNNPSDYLYYLPKIEMYNKQLYVQVKNIEMEILEINSSVPELYL